ncbi:TPA: restriction endonuclease, partial [Citrobacter freundii]
MAKPNLYRGKPLPLSQLTSDEFENFVYSILSIIGKHQQFRVENGGQKSGDEGYDCTARSTLDNSLICIQCKRYSSA